MKGMMVPLLVVMLTGMVNGRQIQAQESSGDSGGVKIGRYVLDMTDQWIDSLKENGLLQAPIKPEQRDHISEIVIRYDDDTGLADLIPAQITQVPSGFDNKIQFVLTDGDIEIMKNRGLRYSIRAEDRGKYDTVLVRYESAGRAVSGATGRAMSQTTSNGFDPGNSRAVDNSNSAAANTDFGSGMLSRQQRGNSILAPRSNSASRRRDSNLANGNNGAYNFDNPRSTGTQLPNLTGGPSNSSNSGRLLANGSGQPYQAVTGDSFADNPSTINSWTNRQNNSRLDPQSVSSASSVQERSFENGFGPVAIRNQANVRPTELQARQDPMSREEADRLERQSFELEKLRAQRLAREKFDIQEQLERERYLKSLRNSQDSQRIAEDRYAMRSDNRYTYPYSDDSRPLIDYPTNQFPNRQSEDYGDQLVNSNTTTPSSPPERVTIGPKPSGPVPAAIGGPDGNNYQRVAQDSTNESDCGKSTGNSGRTAYRVACRTQYANESHASDDGHVVVYDAVLIRIECLSRLVARLLCSV